MNMKETKKMRKLIMCQSVDVTTSCMIPDCRPVIRSRRSTDQTLVEHTSNTKYVRLAEDRRYLVPESRRPLSSLSSSTDNGVKLDQNALPLSPENQVFQVVVMRVSIHCQGCAGKVKKHLSKMEGVTSFSVDLGDQEGNVMGHVSPVAVLESMSKVKKAEFWPPNLIPM